MYYTQGSKKLITSITANFSAIIITSMSPNCLVYSIKEYVYYNIEYFSQETILISETSGLFPPDRVAEDLICGVENGSSLLIIFHFCFTFTFVSLSLLFHFHTFTFWLLCNILSRLGFCSRQHIIRKPL